MYNPSILHGKNDIEKPIYALTQHPSPSCAAAAHPSKAAVVISETLRGRAARSTWHLGSIASDFCATTST